MKSKQEILEGVKRCIDNVVTQNKPITEQSTFGSLNFDSLDGVEFVMECEDEFELEIPDEEVEQLKTVGAFVDYIEGKINK